MCCAQVPIQLASAGVMLAAADWAEARLRAADIAGITALFFVLVLLAATQDIAVDGWALTLLSRPNIGCGSPSWSCHPMMYRPCPAAFPAALSKQCAQERSACCVFVAPVFRGVLLSFQGLTHACVPGSGTHACLLRLLPSLLDQP